MISFLSRPERSCALSAEGLSTKLGVLLADRDPAFVASLFTCLATHPSMGALASVDEGGDLLSRAIQDKPDIVCLDTGMPGLNALAATRYLHEILPEIKVIGLWEGGDLADLRALLAMLEAGAAGCVTRKEGVAGLRRAILGVGRYGKIYLCEEVASEVLAAL